MTPDKITETIKVTMDKRLAELELSIVDFIDMCINDYIENNPYWLSEQLELDPETSDDDLYEITTFELERVQTNDSSMA